MDAPDEIEFTFSWLALKLLGKGLYSNPWSALSELVANGFDAGASTVHVSIDIRDKNAASIEVFDDGAGMSRTDLDTYVKVGHNKRRDPEYADKHADQAMGRKGIGKLAALYLSPMFFIRTRRDGQTSTWVLDARGAEDATDEHPRLTSSSVIPGSLDLEKWESYETGTFLSLQQVDLRGNGDQSLEALGARLANQFLFANPNENRRILLKLVRSDDDVTGDFQPVKKNVAFYNFAFGWRNFAESHAAPRDLDNNPNAIFLPASGLPGGAYRHVTQVEAFEVAPDTSGPVWASIGHRVNLEERTYDDIPYALTGWIGVHGTIDRKEAVRNDSRFKKNRFFNPAQLRVYVRGKLASDRLLGQLGLTGTYLNYIEGEISFDLLDDTNLPDIATSNRQDFDESDDRVTLLRTLVRPIIRSLINKRQELAARISEQVKEEKERRESAAKAEFSEQFANDLARYPDLPQAEREEIHLLATNKIQGDVVAKTAYRVFISHSGADARFSGMIYELLLAKGATPDEIFYTSDPNAQSQYTTTQALSSVIRESITNASTLIFYMTSRNFISSQFCLFEGGAGWATRAVGEYLKLNVDFDAIPAFLTEGEAEMTLLRDGDILLRPDLYRYLVEGILNRMIRHLNRGRRAAEVPLIEEFGVGNYPSAVEMARAGTTHSDYYDPMIVEHWEVHVKPGLDQYIKDYSDLV